MSRKHNNYYYYNNNYYYYYNIKIRNNKVRMFEVLIVYCFLL